MRTPSTLALLLFAMMTACSDYQLDAHKGDESGGTDDDVDDEVVVDTDTGEDDPGGDTDDDAVVELSLIHI